MNASPPPVPLACAVRAQSLAYSSDSHGNRTLTRPDPSGSCVSVTVPLTSPAHREPIGEETELDASPYRDRSCCPDTVIQVSYPRTASKTWREVVTVYRPSNGAPTAFSATALPARTSGLPRITASSSANDPAIRSASAFAVRSTWACVPYAASVTTNRASPNGADTSAAVTPSSSVGVVPAGARPTSGCFAPTSQPRTSTSATCSAADTPARQRSRLLPNSSTSGSRSARAEASGALPASAGFVMWSRPSRTYACAPASSASPRTNSQSVTLGWAMCSSTGPAMSTGPGRSPARWATWPQMSASVMFW